MREMVYLNGDFVPLADAKVSVLDRGFILGDGVYEVIPAYGRAPFRLREHLARLAYSLSEIRLANPHDDATWMRLVQAVVDQNPWDDQSVYLQVTRGVAPRSQEFPRTAVPATVFIMSYAMRSPSREQRERGVAVTIREDYRWRRCDIKATSLLANCLLRQEAEDAGCAEVVLVRDGHVTEASTCNVFMVQHGVIINPPKDRLILPGITYDLVLELARANALPTEVRPVALAELLAADEAWLSSSTKEVLPITQIDGKPVGDGKPGPVYARMYALFQDYKARAGRTAYA